MEEIQKEIECWASCPTWFSSHPSDTKELRQATSNFKRLQYPPSGEELAEAIHQRLPATLKIFSIVPEGLLQKYLHKL